MSTLVDYGSSSDEEDVAKIHEVHALDSNSSERSQITSAVNGTAATQKPVEDESVPVVGPTMPNTSPELLTEPVIALPDGMPERDLLRHLTQASHPITSIPDSPPGSPEPTVEAKFRRFLELKSKGLHFNDDLVKKSSFKNPALFDNLMSRMGLEKHAQYATSLPSAISDPQNMPPHGYKEELLRNQQSIRDRKRQATVAGKRTIEFVSTKNG